MVRGAPGDAVAVDGDDGAVDLDGDTAVDLDTDDADADADAPSNAGRPAGGAAREGRSRGVLTRWPAAVRPWARGPAAAVVLALVAAALGAVAGSAHRGARDAQLALAQEVDVAYTFVAGQEERDGRLRIDLRVGLSNDAAERVSVGLQGLSAPLGAAVERPDDVVLDSGGFVAAPVVAEVDCAALGDGSRVAAPAVLAEVRPSTSGGGVDVRMRVPRDSAELLVAQLVARCAAGTGSDAADSGRRSALS